MQGPRTMCFLTVTQKHVSGKKLVVQSFGPERYVLRISYEEEPRDLNISSSKVFQWVGHVAQMEHILVIKLLKTRQLIRDENDRIILY
jgi:hypothetical protein